VRPFRTAGCIGDGAEGVEEIAAGDAPGLAHTRVAAGEENGAETRIALEAE